MKNKQKEALEFLSSSILVLDPMSVLFNFPKHMSYKKRRKYVKLILKTAAENITISKGGKIEKQKRDISDEMYPTNGDVFNSKEDIANLFNK